MDRNALLTAARHIFLQRFAALLDELIIRSVAGLIAKADQANNPLEQGRLLDARAVLLNQDIALKRQMQHALETLLNRSFQTAYDTFRPTFGKNLDLSALSLVDTSALEDELHVDEIAKQFRAAAEDALRDLNIRIALLFEQEEIRERENPFRPYLLARCIAKALEDLQVDAQLMVPISQQLADELRNEIEPIYAELNSLLAQHGIAAQLQLKIIKSPFTARPGSAAGRRPSEPTADEEEVPVAPPTAPPPTGPTGNRADELLNWVQSGAQGSPAATAGDAAKPRRSWLADARAAGDVLRGLFSARPAPLPAQPDTDYIPLPPGETLGSIAPPPLQAPRLTPPAAQEMWRQDGGVRNLILEQRDGLSARARNEREQMIIDIVGMLFEFILRDNQVPAEVRAQLGRLQFLVLKIAQRDPALFSQKNHPARLLINRIGSIALDLKRLDPEGKRVNTEICHIVETLLADDGADEGLFSRMLDEFDAFVARELRKADPVVERTVQALDHAESRTLRFAHLSGMMAEALTHLRVEPYLHDFLVNTWSRVVERAGRQGLDIARQLRVLAPDLVWSVAPKPTEGDRRQLLGLIPTLLQTLQQGVALIGWTEFEQYKLHNWLIDAHRHALRAGSANPDLAVPERAQIQGYFAQLIRAGDMEGMEAEHCDGIDQGLLSEAMHEMQANLDPLEQSLDPLTRELMAQPDVADPAAEALEIEVRQQLRQGVCVEIQLEPEHEPVRAHLIWVSQDSSHIVLNIENLPAPTILQLRVFRRLLQAGRIHFIETEPLFERAIQSLLASADHLDTRLPSASSR